MLDTAATQDKQEKHGETPSGLMSFGEFGPFLVTILSDSAKGRVVWSHWEQTRSGLAAVLEYEIPQQASHYAVNYCCDCFVPLLAAGGGWLQTSLQEIFTIPPAITGISISILKRARYCG